jgi:broad specificity phosphatase PhoE
MTARLILICHAPTAALRKAAFPADEPLDDNARARAERCWSSPELRTRQTADALELSTELLNDARDAVDDCDLDHRAGEGE